MEEKQLQFIDIENDFTEEELELFKPKADRPLTIEEIIIKEYRGGMTLKQITKSHGVSYGRVYTILDKHGVTKRHGRYNSKSGNRLMAMTNLEKASLIADYNEGLPMMELLEKYNINKHGCYAILDAAGVPRRHNKRPIDLNIEKIANAGEEQVTEVVTEKKTVVKEQITLTVEPSQIVFQPMGSAVKVWKDGDTLHITISEKLVQPVENIVVTIEPTEGEKSTWQMD